MRFSGLEKSKVLMYLWPCLPLLFAALSGAGIRNDDWLARVRLVEESPLTLRAGLGTNHSRGPCIAEGGIQYIYTQTASQQYSRFLAFK